MSSFEQTNLDILIRHFQNGCKLNCTQKLGLEVEHFAVRNDTGESLTYYEEYGVEWILKQLEPYFPSADWHEGHLIGLANNDYTITLEPAAQIEISIAAKEDIDCIYHTYRSFRKLLKPILEEHGCHLENLGYQPKSLVDNLPLIPKERYQFMDRYFRKVDTMGRNMMRGTASTQISIDYRSEEDFVRKIRAAYLLMPAIKFITDNSPIFEGKPAKTRMMRTTIWNHVDHARCGIIPDLFSDSFGFQSYAEYIWHLPMIFVPAENGPVYTDGKPVSELWADRPFSEDDVDHVLSLVFPDVRLKKYIEIRGADCMPTPYIMAYLAFIKGIFFHKHAVHEVLSAFPDVRAEDIRKADASLMENGYKGTLYGVPAEEFFRHIYEIALERLDASERRTLEPLIDLYENRTTLAEQSRMAGTLRP